MFKFSLFLKRPAANHDMIPPHRFLLTSCPSRNREWTFALFPPSERSTFSQGQSKKGIGHRRTNRSSHNQPRSLTKRLRKRAISGKISTDVQGINRRKTSDIYAGLQALPVTLSNSLCNREVYVHRGLSSLINLQGRGFNIQFSGPVA